MSRIRVSVRTSASRREVWDHLADIASHVEWMREAVALRFSTSQRAGVGTTFECDTKVGPLRVTDVMAITEWQPRRVIGVRHVGVVTGEGRFTLRRNRVRRGTTITWDERLRFPWWLGGPVGAVVGGRVLRVIWKQNLRALRARVERASRTADGGSRDHE